MSGAGSGVLVSLKARLEALAAAVAILVATILFALLVRRIMRRSLQGRLPQYVYKPLENITVYTIIFLGAVAALAVLGVNLSGLLVAGGIAGIVIGFASQQAVSNLISGLFLLMEQPLRIGDPVTLGDVSGVVADINIFSTRIRTWDGTIVRVPNSTAFTSIITNYYRTRARRVEIRIGLSYGTDIDKAINVLRGMMEEHPFCLVNPAPEVFVEDYGDSAIVFTMRCWAPPQVWFATKVDLQTRLKKELDKAGIEIPFPQLDLHIKDSAPIPVEGLREGVEKKQ
ncbi:mechanosensitive ion channel family protein [Pyrofollis japonicus]|uniref:mechanosensitive ion channel family protein n=1 Tax=Pyrofollis japonicus TaxID=3060460 RepID=UPI00295B7914|nr:mechanosensitive ion channel family protein [Pyrofollis japonicus]BEP17883.1 mechanosensitive ion channel family protein [Pyrofollis japonicus]